MAFYCCYHYNLRLVTFSNKRQRGEYGSQYQSEYQSVYQSASVSISQSGSVRFSQYQSVSVSIPVSISQHQSAPVSISQHQSASISISQHQSVSISINQYTSQYQSVCLFPLRRSVHSMTWCSLKLWLKLALRSKNFITSLHVTKSLKSGAELALVSVNCSSERVAFYYYYYYYWTDAHCVKLITHTWNSNKSLRR